MRPNAPERKKGKNRSKRKAFLGYFSSASLDPVVTMRLFFVVVFPFFLFSIPKNNLKWKLCPLLFDLFKCLRCNTIKKEGLSVWNDDRTEHPLARRRRRQRRRQQREQQQRVLDGTRGWRLDVLVFAFDFGFVARFFHVRVRADDGDIFPRNAQFLCCGSNNAAAAADVATRW